MKKNYLFWFAILAFLLLGCRNDNFNPNDASSNQRALKFRVVPASEIPQIMNVLQSKTNNFKVPLKNHSSANGKTETAFGDVVTSYIIESTNGSEVVYYTFPILPKSGDDSEAYNLVVKADNTGFASAQVVAYEPTAEWLQNENGDYLKFSGNVKNYSVDGTLEGDISYVLGTPNCQPDPPCPDCPTQPQGPGNPHGPGNDGGGTGGGTTGGGGSGGGGTTGGGTTGGGTTGGGTTGGGTTGGGTTGGGTTGSGGETPDCSWQCIDDGDEGGGCHQEWICETTTGAFTARQIKNCDITPEGGGGGGVVITTTQDPCTKTKALLTNVLMQNSVAQLKDNATSGTGEMGFKANKAGTPTVMIPGGDHSVNFGDKTGYAGGYHNHTKTGIPMDSPADINQLLGFARAQGNNGDPTQAFVGMVAPNGMHYIIRFAGTYQDSVNFNFMQEDIDNYTDNMAMNNSIFKSSSSTQGIEKLFFKTLNDMGLDGKIILQRVENDSTIKTINKNNDGTITAVPCS